MRIVTLFTVFVIILFRVLPVSAQENKDYSLSISPQLGVFYGHVEEIVCPPPEIKADMLSQLLWDLKPVFYYGFLMELSPVRPMEKWRFFFDLSFKFSIPGRSGVMEDRDWESVENTGLTKFSSHDNIAKQLILIDFSAGVSFPLRNILLFKTFIHISYMNLNFTGENGHLTYAKQLGDGIYAPIDNDPIVYSLNGKVINYSQAWFYAAPGISLGYGYKDYFRVEISFTISPLILCTDFDEHILTNTQYMDKMKGGIMLEPGLLFSLNLSKRLGISCDVSWRYISRTKGLTYIRHPIDAGDYTQEGKAGAGLSIFNTALLLKVKL